MTVKSMAPSSSATPHGTINGYTIPIPNTDHILQYFNNNSQAVLDAYKNLEDAIKSDKYKFDDANLIEIEEIMYKVEESLRTSCLEAIEISSRFYDKFPNYKECNDFINNLLFICSKEQVFSNYFIASGSSGEEQQYPKYFSAFRKLLVAKYGSIPPGFQHSTEAGTTSDDIIQEIRLMYVAEQAQIAAQMQARLESQQVHISTSSCPAATILNDNRKAITEGFKTGKILFRAVCFKEMTSRIIEGSNPVHDETSKFAGTYRYASTSAVPRKDARQGMRLFGFDKYAIVIDPNGIRQNAHTNTNESGLDSQIVMFSRRNAATYSKETRLAKQQAGTAGNLDDLIDQIAADARNAKGPLNNSEVLTAGINPQRIRGILLRAVNDQFKHSDAELQSLIDSLRKPPYLYPDKTTGSIYPIYLYREGTPHGLVELTIDNQTTPDKIRAQVFAALQVFKSSSSASQEVIQFQAQLAASKIELRVSAPTLTEQKYAAGDKDIFNTLLGMLEHNNQPHLNQFNLSLASLMKKLTHTTIGHIRMDKCRDLIEELISPTKPHSYGSDAHKELLNLIHYRIDLDSINYNLSMSNQMQLSLSACQHLKDTSYIIRRQLEILTNSNIFPNPNDRLNRDEIEQIANFINDDSIKNIPLAFAKLSAKERWNNIFDPVAGQILRRINAIDPQFKLNGLFEPPTLVSVVETCQYMRNFINRL